jgi:ssDNA-specific exonuclease RecJ
VNSYNNTESLSLIVEDIHDCGLNIENPTEKRYNNDYCMSNSFTLTRRDMLLFYKVLRKFYKDGFRFYDLYNIRRILQSEGFNWYKLRKALDVFIELDLVRRDTKEIYTLNLDAEKVELDTSHLYKALNGER